MKNNNLATVLEMTAPEVAPQPVLETRIGQLAEHGRRIARANRTIATLLLRHRPGMSAARLFFVGIVVATPFVMNWSVGQIIEALAQRQTIDVWGLPTLGLALGLIVSGALPLVMTVFDRLIENWAFTFVQQAQVLKVPELDPVTYSDPSLKDKIQNVQERAVWRIMALAKTQVMLTRAIALALITTTLLWRFDGALCVILVTAMIPSMAAESVHAYRQFKIDESQGDWWRRFWEERGHILNSKTLAYLQVFGAARWFAGRFADGIARAISAYDILERRSVIKRIVAMVCGMSAVIFGAFTLVRSVTAGHLAIADFVFYLGTLSLLGASLAEIASALGLQLGQSLYVESFEDVLAIESRTHYPEVGVSPQVTADGVTLELRDVRFGYPQGAGQRNREIIRGISLAIPAGEKWAVVGVNGAGKSTLKALIVRLFDPDHGEVRLGGVPVSALDEPTLRAVVGCLPQDIQHFNLTVEEFIALGRSGQPIDRVRVAWAAKRSGAAVFVERYPRGYRQRLGRDYRDTEEPSGGQLQKLALASLLYMRAPLMVLDEPTAAIDPEAARDFWDTLFHESPGQTVVFSTHYLGAVRRADRIVVIDAGQVLATGRHADLMEGCEVYRRLFESQARDYRG
jgi:ATP-binding cassette subfamily B protein